MSLGGYGIEIQRDYFVCITCLFICCKLRGLIKKYGIWQELLPTELQ